MFLNKRKRLTPQHEENTDLLLSINFNHLSQLLQHPTINRPSTKLKHFSFTDHLTTDEVGLVDTGCKRRKFLKRVHPDFVFN